MIMHAIFCKKYSMYLEIIYILELNDVILFKNIKIIINKIQTNINV